MSTVGFFNVKGGVGKTALVYHAAWMLAERGTRVLAVDLDPQANLTSMFLSEDRLEQMWLEPSRPTLHGALSPLFRGIADIETPHVEPVADRIGLLAGDLAVSGFEDQLSKAWVACRNRDERAFRVTSALARTVDAAKVAYDVDLALVDIGPNLGALDRAALLACDAVVVPLGADLFSAQALRIMGPTMAQWREEWTGMRAENPASDLALPLGRMKPVGYVVMRHVVPASRPARAYERRMARIPVEYRKWMLHEHGDEASALADDPECLAQLQDYPSLARMAREARKPMFLLRPGDGAFGGHQQAVLKSYADFRRLAERIAERGDYASPDTRVAS